jgi:hypothetical protein
LITKKLEFGAKMRPIVEMENVGRSALCDEFARLFQIYRFCLLFRTINMDVVDFLCRQIPGRAPISSVE